MGYLPYQLVSRISSINSRSALSLSFQTVDASNSITGSLGIATTYDRFCILFSFRVVVDCLSYGGFCVISVPSTVVCKVGTLQPLRGVAPLGLCALPTRRWVTYLGKHRNTETQKQKPDRGGLTLNQLDR